MAVVLLSCAYRTLQAGKKVLVERGIDFARELNYLDFDGSTIIENGLRLAPPGGALVDKTKAGGARCTIFSALHPAEKSPYAFVLGKGAAIDISALEHTQVYTRVLAWPGVLLNTGREFIAVHRARNRLNPLAGLHAELELHLGTISIRGKQRLGYSSHSIEEPQEAIAQLGFSI